VTAGLLAPSSDVLAPAPSQGFWPQWHNAGELAGSQLRVQPQFGP